MTNESHTDWWNQYLESDDPDHVVVQMDKEIELLRDQRDSNMAKEVERIASLTTQRDEYKVWWERDSTSLGKALNEVSSLRAVREESRAAIEQLHAAVKTAQELAATRLMEIERLSKREKTLMDVIDSRDRALGFVPLDDALHPGPSISKAFANSPRRVSDEPNSCASFPVTHEMGLWMEDYLNVLCDREAMDISLPQRRFLNDRIDAVRACLASVTFTKGASRDASPADLVGALQDVVHTDPGPVRAGKAHRDANSWADAKGGLPDNKL